MSSPITTTQYTQEQFWKLYEKLPQELKDALWAQETGDDILEVCQKYNATERLQDVSWLTGQVLVGLVLPQELSDQIQQLGIAKESAELIAREINRSVFYPVKQAIEQLHRMEIEVSAKIVTPKPEESEEEKPEESKGEDTYREPIE